MPVFRMLRTRRGNAVGAVLALGLALGLSGCGGGSNPASPSTPAATTTVLQQGTFTLLSVPNAQGNGFAFDAARVEFTTSATGSLQAVVDWTNASNAMAVAFFPGSCTYSLFYANGCTEVASQDPTTNKPIKLGLANAAAGTYTMIVANAGIGNESGSYQILLTK